MGNKMSDSLRRLRLRQLGEVGAAYVNRFVDKDGETNDWLLSFPEPNIEQEARICDKTGKVLRYIHQAGTEAREVDPSLYLATIDRRINYLWQTYKHLYQPLDT